jgi:hypothetical protein
VNKYTTLRKRLRTIASLAADASKADYETMDSIGNEAHRAMRDVDELDTAPATLHELRPITLTLVEDERKEVAR